MLFLLGGVVMVPVFTLKLSHKILPRLVTVGKYDGDYPCITAATNGNKVNITSFIVCTCVPVYHFVVGSV